MYSTIPVLCHYYTPGMQPGHHMIMTGKYIYSHSWVLADVAITVWLLEPDKSAILVEEEGLTGFGVNVYHEWKRNGKRVIKNSLHTGLTIIISRGRDNEVQSFLSTDTSSEVTDSSDTSSHSSSKLHRTNAFVSLKLSMGLNVSVIGCFSVAFR